MTMQTHKRFSVSLLTKEHVIALRGMARDIDAHEISRIYLNADLAFDEEVLGECTSLSKMLPNAEWVLELPKILRKNDSAYLDRVWEFLKESPLFHGILIANLEAAGYFADKKDAIRIYGDHYLYLWNSLAVKEWESVLDGGCLPLELRYQEQKELLSLPFSWEKLVYGRIPMMLTANCIAKTNGNCPARAGETFALSDRLGKTFPVYLNCKHCHNIIYNSLPLSLHVNLERLQEDLLLRITLTTENASDARKVLMYFLGGQYEQRLPFPFESTTGHEKRGAL
ncbi:MAG: hypothetical protein J5546_06160 [Lachnospiraceae bacterium]|nr:hypothetical protein [Lachnospiraceae bacterium]